MSSIVCDHNHCGSCCCGSCQGCLTDIVLTEDEVTRDYRYHGSMALTSFGQYVIDKCNL